MSKCETAYCSSCGGTGESWNPMRGLFEGPCRPCKGTGLMRVVATSQGEKE